MPIQPFFEEGLKYYFGKDYEEVFKASLLLQYLELKTRSIEKSSKSRANYGNIYAIYVLVEDYLNNKFDENNNYSSYEGAKFSDIFRRQRELPFGEKLQNHALNHRCNEEFRKFFRTSSEVPITRNLATSRYWINEKLLLVNANSKTYNIAKSLIGIINEYVSKKQSKSLALLQTCLKFKESFRKEEFIEFVKSLLSPTVDARTFEIVSFTILKNYYSTKNIQLFKTGRTNANDGGIDFVMRPEGRFFQVTEVLDFKKYFLDIDKINRYPITFVIKSSRSPKELRLQILTNARRDFQNRGILNKYMDAIEEIISIPTLLERLDEVIQNRMVTNLLEDLILYYKIEFNIK